MNTDILDKKIILIDSSKCIFNNSNYDFYLDIQTPIKDVLFIKIISSTISISTELKINNTNINDLDNIFIYLNDYKRIITNNSNTNDNIFNYFDNILIDTTKYSNTSTEFNFTNLLASNSDITDTSIYVLNPAEPSLKRFNIKLYDNNNNIISKTDNLNRIVIKLCIYTSRKKITMN